MRILRNLGPFARVEKLILFKKGDHFENAALLGHFELKIQSFRAEMLKRIRIPDEDVDTLHTVRAFVQENTFRVAARLVCDELHLSECKPKWC